MEKKITETKGTIELKLINANPNNPRTIKKNQLEKLKKSISEFPEMLELRPLVVDEDMVVLGGNMRLKALKELNFTQVPYIQVLGLTDEQKQQFVIKDNVNYGDWDWGVLQNSWNVDGLGDWGLDVPEWVIDGDTEPEIDLDELDQALNKYIDGKIKQITCYFDTKEYGEMIKKLEYIKDKEKLENHTKVLQYLTELYGEVNKLNN